VNIRICPSHDSFYVQKNKVLFDNASFHMDDKVQVKLPSIIDDFTTTRSRLDHAKVRGPHILVSGRLGDPDIEKARTQIATLRSEVRSTRSHPLKILFS